MAFIGTPLDTRNTFQSLVGKRFNGDGSTTAFTLDVAPSSTLDIEVFVGNVRQDPNSAYTLSGTTLTFTGAPPSGTNNIYVVHQAKSVGTINAPDNSVDSAQLNTAILTGATDIGANIADADLFLIDDGAGGTLRKTAASRIKTYVGGVALANDANNRIVTADGSDGLNGEANFTFDGEKAVLDSGSSNDTPALKIIQKGGYAGMEIEGDATNTGTAALVIDASGSGDSSIDFQNAGNHKWRIKSDYSDSHRFYIMDADTSAWVYLDQNDTSFNSSSDERLKTDWVNITNATDKINTLTKVGKFKRKQYDKENNQITDPTSTKEHYGLSAQEVEAILPEIVNEDVNGIKGMSYTALVPLLVKAIQELSARVKALEEA
jgi:hypothetical protein